ncbi:hypothetical protein [Oceaniglobus roseus]|uniref:hypothetical protein n=1 Tax=Oceaniglobus roseus TaxID=1737570 RepID=UPI00156250AC|nr:hypothetical protein [Kandeliimicrobium roseum]
MRAVPRMPDVRDPRLFYIVAGLALLFALVAVYFEAQNAASRRIALRNGPPPSVLIEDFRPETDLSEIGEVSVTAQVDAALPMLVSYAAGRVRMRAVAFPLLAVGAESDIAGTPPTVLGYAYWPMPVRPVEVLDPTQVLPPYDEVGPFGPILTLNGTAGWSGAMNAEVETFLADTGRPLSGPALAVAPFMNGRVAALEALDGPPRTQRVLLLLGALFVALGVVRSWYRGRQARIEADEAAAAQSHPRPGRPVEPKTDKGRRSLAPLAPQPDLNAAAGAASTDAPHHGAGDRRVAALFRR